MDVSPQVPLPGYIDQLYTAMTGTADCTGGAAFRLRDAGSGLETVVPVAWSTPWVNGVSTP